MAVRHSLAQVGSVNGRLVESALECGNCGQLVTKKVFALRCRKCHTTLTKDSDLAERARPDQLVPFAIDENEARAAFTTWVTTRHFAPRVLKGVRHPESIDGVFLPFWLFTTSTASEYIGERGTKRRRQVARTRTNSNGDTETYWETETYIDWSRADGQVEMSFTDLLVPACGPLAEDLPPWPLTKARPYERGAAGDKRIIAYDVEPEDGFDDATEVMHPQIVDAVHEDIGGNKQRVHDIRTEYSNSSYSLLLLPAWLATYRHRGRAYSLLINGSSAAAVGEHPFSKAKILVPISIAVVLATVAGVFLLKR